MRPLALVAVALSLAANAASAQEITFKLEVSQATLNLIAQGIMKLPYEQAAPILNDLKRQVDAQTAKPAAPSPTPEK